MPYFHYTSPIFQLLIGKEKEEFHIKLNRSSHYCRAYKDNTNERLWGTIEDHLLEKWKDTILDNGSDYTEGGTEYIWIHIPKPSKSNEGIKHIIDELNIWFETELSVHMVPKLVSIICKQIEDDNEFFAEALIEYQSKHGKYMTSQTINTYFQDIRRKHMTHSHNYYDYDSD